MTWAGAHRFVFLVGGGGLGIGVVFCHNMLFKLSKNLQVELVLIA